MNHRPALTGTLALAAAGTVALAGCAPTPEPWTPPQQPPAPTLGCYPGDGLDFDVKLIAAAGGLANIEVYGHANEGDPPVGPCAGELVATESYVAATPETALAACQAVDPAFTGDSEEGDFLFDLAVFTTPSSLNGYFYCSNK